MRKKMRVKSNVNAGGAKLKQNQADKGLRVKSGVKAGPGSGGVWLNHNQTVAR
jgi:hypothetical protein